MSSPQKVTLEEYLQAHKIHKKLQERNRSKSKGKKVDFQSQQDVSMQNVFNYVDGLSFKLKVDFHQFLLQNESKEKLIFHLSNLMDKFILKVKEEIKKLYKDIYLQYVIEHQKNVHEKTAQYFKEQFNLADLEVKKMHLAQMMKERSKNQEQKHKILEAIFKTEAQVKLNQDHQQNDNNGFMEALLNIGKSPITATGNQLQDSPARNNNHLQSKVQKHPKANEGATNYKKTSTTPRKTSTQRGLK